MRPLCSATSRGFSYDGASVNDSGPFWRAAEGGVCVAVKVQPKSRRPGLQGQAPDIDGTRLRIGVTEAAEDGRANKAACAALAEAMGLASAAVTVAQGATSRQKTLLVRGDPAHLSATLVSLSGTPA